MFLTFVTYIGRLNTSNEHTIQIFCGSCEDLKFKYLNTPILRLVDQSGGTIYCEKNWAKGSNNTPEIEYPKNQNWMKKQRQEVYDKFYSRVTFESVQMERGFVNCDTGDISTKRMSSIRIGTDILLSYEGLKYDQDRSDYIDISIVYEQADDTTPRVMRVYQAWEDPFAGDDSLDEFRDVLGLDSITDPGDLVDLITFAFPLTIDEIDVIYRQK